MTSLNSEFRVTVIIPFFQYRRGSLVAAVRSCLEQRHVQALSVIVVDDGSPLSARQELAELSDRENSRVSVIEQPNGGPGSARNRGLSALPDDANVVAFLDSDDQWDQDHISNALVALAAGADFYFSDYLPLGSIVSTFEQCNLTPLVGKKMGPLPGALLLYIGSFRRLTREIACRDIDRGLSPLCWARHQISNRFLLRRGCLLLDGTRRTRRIDRIFDQT